MIGNGMNRSADSGFMNHKPIYICIAIFNAIEMVLNFLTIRIVDAKIIEDPALLTLNYMKFHFFKDVISMITWPFFLPSMTFLRLVRVSKMSEYQDSIDDSIRYYFAGLVNTISLKKILNAVDLITKLSFMAHLFANLWIAIGNFQLEFDTGWMLAYREDGMLS